MSKAWKEAEKEVAEFFGGLRRIRISYSESIGDVLHAYFSIEVKYGLQVPKYLDADYPKKLMVLKEVKPGVLPVTRRYNVVPSKCLIANDDVLCITEMILRTQVVSSAKFLENAFDQAEKYDDVKEPIVCVKPKYKRGFIAIWRAT